MPGIRSGAGGTAGRRGRAALTARAFVHEPLPGRTVFAAGAAASLAQELTRLDLERAFVVCTPQREHQARLLTAPLGARVTGVFARAEMHVPAELVEDALRAAQAAGADACVAIGGGSTIGLAKGMALASGLPIAAVPTTYSGSEMTPIYGITRAATKTTGRDARVLPRLVIYDPTLTYGVSPQTSAASGMNALAHAVEALYAHDRSPVLELIAHECIRTLRAALPAVVADGNDAQARSDALYGAWLGGMALGGASMGLHHKLCHVLGGTFGLPHAQTHAVMLPYTAAYNGVAEWPEFYAMLHALPLPTSLAALGLRHADLAEAARLACAAPYPNPRPLEQDRLRAMLESAFAGRAPGEGFGHPRSGLPFS